MTFGWQAPVMELTARIEEQSEIGDTADVRIVEETESDDICVGEETRRRYITRRRVLGGKISERNKRSTKPSLSYSLVTSGISQHTLMYFHPSCHAFTAKDLSRHSGGERKVRGVGPVSISEFLTFYIDFLIHLSLGTKLICDRK